MRRCVLSIILNKSKLRGHTIAFASKFEVFYKNRLTNYYLNYRFICSYPLRTYCPFTLSIDNFKLPITNIKPCICYLLSHFLTLMPNNNDTN